MEFREPSRILILGDGQMGLALADALLCPERSREVIVWSAFREDAEALRATRRTDRLPGFTLDPSVQVISGDDELLSDADLVISAAPCQHTRAVWRRVGGLVSERAPIVSVTKGIEVGTLQSPAQTIAEALSESPNAAVRSIGALSGPTIAAELVGHHPAAMVVASDDSALAELVQQAFETCGWVRVYTCEDMVGVELAGAVKNVIALAAGVIDGLGAGYNAKSSLLARGLAEIVRLGVAMGARPETFFGVAGVGDLATTCFCPSGRNRSCGEALGRGKSLDEYLASTNMVVEGVETTRGVCELSRRHNVEMPIAHAVHAVLFEGMSPTEAISLLMSRPATTEQIG